MSTSQGGAAVKVIRQMAHKLMIDIAALERTRASGVPRTVPEFRRVRDLHDDIQGLVLLIEDRISNNPEGLPDGFREWLFRAKFRALGVFAEISRQFVENPPLALTQSLTARDVLDAQKATFEEALQFFNKMLMEYALDDKTASELDRVQALIEETIGIVDKLLAKSANYLEEFS